MPTFDMQDATDADVPRILEIRYAAFARHAPSAYSEREVEILLGDVDEAELAEMIKDHRLFVARKEGKVVGLAGWSGASVRHVYIDPDETRRGIASRLRAHVEADFRRRTHADEIKAGVALHAEPFYVSNGYEVVNRAKAWDGSDYLEMVKRF